jgi:prolipoprotein diacylglyceryltransferase
MEFTLPAAALTAVAAMWLANRLLARRITVDRPTDALVASAAIGLAVGRIAAMIGAGVNPLTHPGDILIVRGGVATGAAALGALVALSWIYRHSLPVALDQTAPAALAGLAGWHGGCIWRGTCLGTATDLPWAILSDGTEIGRHPVELYTAGGFILAAVAVTRWMTRPWVAAGAALAAAGVVRLSTEPLRLTIVGGPVGWYAAAILVGAGVAIAGHRRIRTRPPGPSSIEM